MHCAIHTPHRQSVTGFQAVPRIRAQAITMVSTQAVTRIRAQAITKVSTQAVTGIRAQAIPSGQDCTLVTGPMRIQESLVTVI